MKTVVRYQIAPVKGGYVLSTLWQDKTIESEVFTSFLTLIAKLADQQGVLTDEGVKDDRTKRNTGS